MLGVHISRASSRNVVTCILRRHSPPAANLKVSMSRNNFIRSGITSMTPHIATSEMKNMKGLDTERI